VEGIVLHLAEIITCSTTIDEVTVTVDYYVVNKCIWDTDIILGRDFTDYEEVEYTLTQEKLEFKKKKEGVGQLDVGDLTTEERQRLEDVLSKSKSTKGRFREA